MNLYNINEVCPTIGYILPKWNQRNRYRATAIAYMERENEVVIQHSNGNWYTLGQLRTASISYTNSITNK